MPAHIYVSIDKSYDREKLLFLPSWQPFQHDHPWPPKDPKRFSNGCSPVTIASPIGYNDLTGDGLDHFWECGCSARILQHPNASKYFSLQGAQYISKPMFIYIYISMFSQNITLYGPWIITTGSIINHNYINLWHIWTNWFCADFHMILKGLTFTPTRGCSRLKMVIHEHFTVFPFFFHGLSMAPLQFKMVAKGCNVFFHVFSLYMSSQYRWAITSLENAQKSNDPVIKHMIL